MPVQAAPLGLPTLALSSPAGARIRLGAAKARWLRFRRGRRTRLNVCVLTLLGRHPGVIKRVTLYGAILHGRHRLKRREMIALRLPSGHRVKARVQWRFGSRCGIAFLTPVADFARILSEGGAIASRGRRLRGLTKSAPLAVSPHKAMPPASAPGLAVRLFGLAAWARAHAAQIRAWREAKRDGSDQRPD